MDNESKVYRVQLDFERKDFREIEAIKERLELPNRAEVFRAALVALRWMEAKAQAGKIIAAVDPETGSIAEPEFDFLKATQARAAAAKRPSAKGKKVTTEPPL